MDRDQATIYRWGGAVLGTGFVLVIIAILAYILIYGQPEVTNPEIGITLADRVSHLRDNWEVAQTMWRIEIVGVALLIVAGFILQHQHLNPGDRISPRITWSVVAAGAVVLFLAYPLMLSGYPEAVKLFDTEPGLMAVLNSVAWFTFYFGNALLYLGLAASFALGTQSNGGMQPWLARIGIVSSLLWCAGMIAAVVGYSTMVIVGPFGLLANILGIYLAFSIWQAGTRVGSKRN